MSDDIWILGITMTKFGKHPDKDVVDLAPARAAATTSGAEPWALSIKGEPGGNGVGSSSAPISIPLPVR